MIIKQQGFILNDEIYFNNDNYTITHLKSNKIITLGKNPSMLLSVIIQRLGEIYSSEEFIKMEFLKNNQVITTNSVTQYVSKIRRSLRSIDFTEQVILTAIGDGYYLNNKIKVDAIDPALESADDVEKDADIDSKIGRDTDDADIKSVERPNELTQIQRFSISEAGRSIDSRMIVLILLCLSLVINIALLFINKFNPGQLPTLNVNELYPYHISQDGCEYYMNMASPEDKDNVIAQIKKDANFECDNKKHKYITFFDNAPHYSFISCNVPIQSNEKGKNCFSVMTFNYEK
jgi:DNA-binding winged helix-turn-helix (wHTH) protein